jgi:hypothetical protein
MTFGFGVSHICEELCHAVSAGLYRSMYRVLQWERESCR